MKWINTQELVSLLKRFPNKQIKISAYLGYNINSLYCWEYSQKKNCFICHTGTTSKSFSETEIFRLYCNWHWKVRTIFFLMSNHEKQLAIRLIEELVLLDRLNDIIEKNEIDNVRICEHCHHLMDEGWLVDDIHTFCSDECLLCAFPNICIDELKAHSLDDRCLAYWTKWED